MAETQKATAGPEVLRKSVIRLRSRVMALVCGLVGGVGMLLVTVWHLLHSQGRPAPDIGLLDNYFPGYEVSWAGALLGSIYGAVAGAMIGWTVSWVYNIVAMRRNPV